MLENDSSSKLCFEEEIVKIIFCNKHVIFKVFQVLQFFSVALVILCRNPRPSSLQKIAKSFIISVKSQRKQQKTEFLLESEKCQSGNIRKWVIEIKNLSPMVIQDILVSKQFIFTQGDIKKSS